MLSLAGTPRRWPAKLAAGLLAALALGFLIEAVRFGLTKQYGTDEFQYAHAAWLVARGELPYRDFFDPHFPMLYQVLAPLFLVLDDDPTNIVFLRVAMLLAVAGLLAAAARIQALESRSTALLAPVLLLSTPGFVASATEIRPDSLAFALFLGALALCYSDWPGPRARALMAGFLFSASVWSSQKAAVYGSPLLLGLALDLGRNARRGSRCLLGSPFHFVAGALSGVLLVCLYLTLSGSWETFVFWCFRWAWHHQSRYPGFSWLRHFRPFLAESGWLLPLALLGIGSMLHRLARAGAERWAEPDLLLLCALPCAFGSYALQKAPFWYSLVPFLGLLGLNAARGTAWAARLLARGEDSRASGPRPLAHRLALGLLLAWLIFGLGRSIGLLEARLASTNAHQHAVLARLHELTAPEDTVYDNTGAFVSRPHVWFYFYTDALLRLTMKEQFVREVPPAILERECVLVLVDKRFPYLPEPLQAFLRTNFQPLDRNLWIWGRRYLVPPAGRLDAVFLAVRAGRYFVEPRSALEGGTLQIGDLEVTEPVFSLEKGSQSLAYTGPARELFVLWLPRDGKPWVPRPGLAARLPEDF